MFNPVDMGNENKFKSWGKINNPLVKDNTANIWVDNIGSKKAESIIQGLTPDEILIILKEDFLVLLHQLSGANFKGFGEINDDFIKKNVSITSIFDDPDGYVDTLVGFLLKITKLNSQQLKSFNAFIKKYPDINEEYNLG